MAGWQLPGQRGNAGSWAYDLSRGWLPPGMEGDAQGTQLEMPEHWDPSRRDAGWHTVISPPGVAAPPDAINYTPQTNEVHAQGYQAPIQHENLSIMPVSLPDPRSGGGYVGMGQDLTVGYGADQLTTPDGVKLSPTDLPNVFQGEDGSVWVQGSSGLEQASPPTHAVPPAAAPPAGGTPKPATPDDVRRAAAAAGGYQEHPDGSPVTDSSGQEVPGYKWYNGTPVRILPPPTPNLPNWQLVAKGDGTYIQLNPETGETREVSGLSKPANQGTWSQPHLAEDGKTPIIVNSATGEVLDANTHKQLIPPVGNKPGNMSVGSAPPQGGAEGSSGGSTIYSPYDQIFRKYAGDLANNDEFISIVAAGTKAESGWDPKAGGDGGQSKGLFQINQVHNQPDSVTLDAEQSTAYMMPAYIAAYKQMKAEHPDWKGAQLAAGVAAVAEKPAGWNDPNSAAWGNYTRAYGEVIAQGADGRPVVAASPGGTSGPSGSGPSGSTGIFTPGPDWDIHDTPTGTFAVNKKDPTQVVKLPIPTGLQRNVVGTRLVGTDPTTNETTDLYKAPNMSVEQHGRYVLLVNHDTGETNVIQADPNIQTGPGGHGMMYGPDVNLNIQKYGKYGKERGVEHIAATQPVGYDMPEGTKWGQLTPEQLAQFGPQKSTILPQQGPAPSIATIGKAPIGLPSTGAQGVTAPMTGGHAPPPANVASGMDSAAAQQSSSVFAPPPADVAPPQRSEAELQGGEPMRTEGWGSQDGTREGTYKITQEADSGDTDIDHGRMIWDPETNEWVVPARPVIKLSHSITDDPDKMFGSGQASVGYGGGGGYTGPVRVVDPNSEEYEQSRSEYGPFDPPGYKYPIVPPAPLVPPVPQPTPDHLSQEEYERQTQTGTPDNRPTVWPTPSRRIGGGQASGGWGQAAPLASPDTSVGSAGWQSPLDPSTVVGDGNKFGQQVSMEGTHQGTDLQAYEGTPVYSPVDGTVVAVDNDPQGLGIQVHIQGVDGTIHTVAHLLQPDVQQGDQVTMGQPVGKVGQSGAGATGPHLDYRQQSPDGQYINPEPQLGALAQMPPSPDTIGENGQRLGQGQDAGVPDGWPPGFRLPSGADPWDRSRWTDADFTAYQQALRAAPMPQGLGFDQPYSDQSELPQDQSSAYPPMSADTAMPQSQPQSAPMYGDRWSRPDQSSVDPAGENSSGAWQTGMPQRAQDNGLMQTSVSPDGGAEYGVPYNYGQEVLRGAASGAPDPQTGRGFVPGGGGLLPADPTGSSDLGGWNNVIPPGVMPPETAEDIGHHTRPWDEGDTDTWDTRNSGIRNFQMPNVDPQLAQLLAGLAAAGAGGVALGGQLGQRMGGAAAGLAGMLPRNLFDPNTMYGQEVGQGQAFVGSGQSATHHLLNDDGTVTEHHQDGSSLTWHKDTGEVMGHTPPHRTATGSTSVGSGQAVGYGANAWQPDDGGAWQDLWNRDPDTAQRFNDTWDEDQGWLRWEWENAGKPGGDDGWNSVLSGGSTGPSDPGGGTDPGTPSGGGGAPRTDPSTNKYRGSDGNLWPNFATFKQFTDTWGMKFGHDRWDWENRSSPGGETAWQQKITNWGGNPSQPGNGGSYTPQNPNPKPVDPGSDPGTPAPGTTPPQNPTQNLALTEYEKSYINQQQQKIDIDKQHQQLLESQETNRHNEALKSAQSQQDINAENARHNQQMEQLNYYKTNSDAQQAELNRQNQLRQTGSFAQQQQAELLKSALTNPWVQNLTGMAPAFGAAGWNPDSPSALNDLLKGWEPQANVLGSAQNPSPWGQQGGTNFPTPGTAPQDNVPAPVGAGTPTGPPTGGGGVPGGTAPPPTGGGTPPPAGGGTTPPPVGGGVPPPPVGGGTPPPPAPPPTGDGPTEGPGGPQVPGGSGVTAPPPTGGGTLPPNPQFNPAPGSGAPVQSNLPPAPAGSVPLGGMMHPPGWQQVPNLYANATPQQVAQRAAIVRANAAALSAWRASGGYATAMAARSQAQQTNAGLRTAAGTPSTQPVRSPFAGVTPQTSGASPFGAPNTQLPSGSTSVGGAPASSPFAQPSPPTPAPITSVQPVRQPAVAPSTRPIRDAKAAVNAAKKVAKVKDAVMV